MTICITIQPEFITALCVISCAYLCTIGTCQFCPVSILCIITAFIKERAFIHTSLIQRDPVIHKHPNITTIFSCRIHPLTFENVPRRHIYYMIMLTMIIIALVNQPTTNRGIVRSAPGRIIRRHSCIQKFIIGRRLGTLKRNRRFTTQRARLSL